MSINPETTKTPEDVLKKYRKIAVVGLSPDPSRTSYGVASYMQSQGYEIQPVRPGGETILGVKSVATLQEILGNLEIVNVFRRSEFVADVIDEAINAKAKVIWLQEGVTDPVSEEKARKQGIVVFSDLCILKVHKYMG